MPQINRRSAGEWRKSLTMDEAVRVAEIEARIAALVEERAKLSRDLHLIRNRAGKRAVFIPVAKLRALRALPSDEAA